MRDSKGHVRCISIEGNLGSKSRYPTQATHRFCTIRIIRESLGEPRVMPMSLSELRYTKSVDMCDP